MGRRMWLCKVRLVAYDFPTLPLWSMPSRLPSPTPLAPGVPMRRMCLHKIHLIPLPISETA
jgi:hypothetical protein